MNNMNRTINNTSVTITHTGVTQYEEIRDREQLMIKLYITSIFNQIGYVSMFCDKHSHIKSTTDGSDFLESCKYIKRVVTIMGKLIDNIYDYNSKCYCDICNTNVKSIIDTYYEDLVKKNATLSKMISQLNTLVTTDKHPSQ